MKQVVDHFISGEIIENHSPINIKHRKLALYRLGRFNNLK